MAKRNYWAEFKEYRGEAIERAAVEAFYNVADHYGLTYEDLAAEEPREQVKEAYGAAIDAAWPNRLDGSKWSPFEGHIEVHQD